MPLILIEKRDAFLDGRREVSVAGDQAAHTSSAVVVDFVEDDVDSFFKFALGLTIMLVKFPEKLDH